MYEPVSSSRTGPFSDPAHNHTVETATSFAANTIVTSERTPSPARGRDRDALPGAAPLMSRPPSPPRLSTSFPLQVLANEYTAQQNIGTHYDDALAFGPLVLGVSLAGDCSLTLTLPLCMGAETARRRMAQGAPPGFDLRELVRAELKASVDAVAVAKAADLSIPPTVIAESNAEANRSTSSDCTAELVAGIAVTAHAAAATATATAAESLAVRLGAVPPPDAAQALNRNAARAQALNRNAARAQAREVRRQLRAAAEAAAAATEAQATIEAPGADGSKPALSESSAQAERAFAASVADAYGLAAGVSGGTAAEADGAVLRAAAAAGVTPRVALSAVDAAVAAEWARGVHEWALGDVAELTPRPMTLADTVGVDAVAAAILQYDNQHKCESNDTANNAQLVSHASSYSCSTREFSKLGRALAGGDDIVDFTNLSEGMTSMFYNSSTTVTNSSSTSASAHDSDLDSTRAERWQELTYGPRELARLKELNMSSTKDSDDGACGRSCNSCPDSSSCAQSHAPSGAKLHSPTAAAKTPAVIDLEDASLWAETPGPLPLARFCRCARDERQRAVTAVFDTARQRLRARIVAKMNETGALRTAAVVLKDGERTKKS